ncbi:MAG: hypothetical protein WBS18_04020 [Candidatus Acidiferrales bacterium]|jgi:hypothetical protein
MQRLPENAPIDAKPAAPKKKYVKPRCVSEPIYETLALACGKLPAQGGFCNSAPFKS